MKKSKRLNKIVFFTHSKKTSKKLRPKIKRDFFRGLKHTKRPIEKFEKSNYKNILLSDSEPTQICCGVKSFIVFEGRAYDRENFSRNLFWMNPPQREMDYDEKPEELTSYLEAKSDSPKVSCHPKKYPTLDEQEAKRVRGVYARAYFGDWESDN